MSTPVSHSGAAPPRFDKSPSIIAPQLLCLNLALTCSNCHGQNKALAATRPQSRQPDYHSNSAYQNECRLIVQSKLGSLPATPKLNYPTFNQSIQFNSASMGLRYLAKLQLNWIMPSETSPSPQKPQERLQSTHAQVNTALVAALNSWQLRSVPIQTGPLITRFLIGRQKALLSSALNLLSNRISMSQPLD